MVKKKKQPMSERHREHLKRYSHYMGSKPQEGQSIHSATYKELGVHTPRRRGKYRVKEAPVLRALAVEKINKLRREREISTYYSHLINLVPAPDRPSIRLTGRLEIYITDRSKEHRHLTDAHLEIPGMDILVFRKTVRESEMLPPAYKFEDVTGVAFDFAYRGNACDLVEHLCAEYEIYGARTGVHWKLGDMVARHPLDTLSYTIASSPP